MRKYRITTKNISTNKKIWLVGLLCALLLGLFFIYFFNQPRVPSSGPYGGFTLDDKILPQEPALIIGDTSIFVTKAVTMAEIRRGLSGQESLPPSNGMLFIFDSDDYYRFWMPDMRFPLDIVWIGADKKIVDISKNVPPLLDTGKPVFYSPRVPARYVLEVNAGFSDAHGIAPGDNIQFLSI
ncbi:MAG: DUF192 domain-containing protein [Candidatus Paceibacterota bacterium]|jgi:hypothetical protein